MDLSCLDRKISNGFEDAMKSIFDNAEIIKKSEIIEDTDFSKLNYNYKLNLIQDDKLQKDVYYIEPDYIYNKDSTKKLFFPGKYILYPKKYNNWSEKQKKHWISAIKQEEIRYLKILLCQKKMRC